MHINTQRWQNDIEGLKNPIQLPHGAMNCEYGEPPLLLKPHLVEIKVSCKFNIQVLALSPVCDFFKLEIIFKC